MLNNYDAVLLALTAFLVDNAPGGAEREVARMQANLVEGCPSDYINLEFRPEPDLGCTLYVRVEGPEGKYGNERIEDAEGNLWYAYVVKCEVSWASWGADNLATTQRRLALMTKVTRFACDVERAFPEVFHHLSQTKADRDAMEIRNAKSRAIAEVERLVKTHAKGMKVGQSKAVFVGPGFDLTSITDVNVQRSESGRIFKYHASVDSKQALVDFIRLEA